jgi:hypothetical protein
VTPIQNIAWRPPQKPRERKPRAALGRKLKAKIGARLADPWMGVRADGMIVTASDARSRMEIVREAPAERLRAIIAFPGTQPTVRRLAVKRFKRLTKAAGEGIRERF